MPATNEPSLDLPRTERRDTLRGPARLAVFVLRRHDPSHSSLLASTRDVHLGGMFVEMRYPPPVGTVLEIEVFRADLEDPPVRGRAVVRWRHARGIGVEMLRLGNGHRERLSRWLGDVYGQPEAG